MSKYTDTKEYIEQVDRLLELLSKCDGSAPDSIVDKILLLQSELNKTLFSTASFSALCYNPDERDFALSDMSGFADSVRVWMEYVDEIAEMIKHKRNSLDGDFYAMMEYINISDSEYLLSDMKRNLIINVAKDPKTMALTLRFYANFCHLWGIIDLENDEYGMLEDRIGMLKNRTDDFLWLYERLGDYRSKNVLFRTVQNWVSFEKESLDRMKDRNFNEYCDFDLLECSDDEVFVDCGAFTGDTAGRFIEAYKNYKRVYCYEAGAENFEKLEKTVAKYENVTVYRKAVGDTYSKMSIGSSGLGASLLRGGDDVVDLVPIDEDIKEPISLVKMDIEGAEQAALSGMQRHILEDRPKMIICVYHGNRDIIEIPRMIDNMRGDYRFFLRNHGHDVYNIPVDTSLYAL